MHTFVRTAIATAAALAVHAAGAQTRETELRPVDITGNREGETLQLDAPTAGTASRLGLTPRETPASVEVLTQDIMQQRGSRTLAEALRTAPGVTAGNPPSAPTTASTRGFNSLLYLYDGVRTSGAGAVNRIEDTWNYERIEVLKGPASVLNGDSAIGGIINFVTKRPDRNNSSTEGLLSYGSYGSTRAAVGLGRPVGESAAYRIDYSHSDLRVGGIARSGEKVDHLTTGFSFGLGLATQIDLSFDYLRDSNFGYFGTPLVPASFATQPTGVVSTPDGRVIDRRIAGNNYNVADNNNSSDTYTGRARVTHRLTADWTLRNEFTVNKAGRTFQNSESAVFFAPNLITRDQTLITHDQRYLFNRFDASHRGTFGGRENRFVVGGEIGKTEFDSLRRFSDGSASTAAGLRVPALDPGISYFNNNPALSTGAGNRTNVTSDTKNLALFAEDSYKLTKSLTVVGGLRRDRIDIDRTIADLNLNTFSAFGTRYHSTSGRLGAVYDVANNSTLYAQYTNATIPVGTLFLLSAAQAPFPLSSGKQVEVGFKQSLPEQRLDWTAALYRIGLDNVLSRDQTNPNVTVNNGRQSSRGVELSAAWRATSQFTLSGNLAALRAKYDTLLEAGGISRVGNRPPNVPERVANLFATYRLGFIPAELYLGINHTGRMYTDTANQIRINGYTTADAAISYRIKPALLTFRIRNLTDKLYATYAGRATSQVLLAPQRTAELLAKFDF